jgi:hypothetical protein
MIRVSVKNVVNTYKISGSFIVVLLKTPEVFRFSLSIIFI